MYNRETERLGFTAARRAKLSLTGLRSQVLGLAGVNNPLHMLVVVVPGVSKGPSCGDMRRVEDEE
jgi:hypothetical protein